MIRTSLLATPRIRASAGGPSPRRHGSVRRTSTIDVTWPDGLGADKVLFGRARDLVTEPSGTVHTAANVTMRVAVGPKGTITHVATWPEHAGLAVLADGPSMSGYRARLAEAAGEVPAGTALFQLLDDVPGATLVSGYAPRHWHTTAELVTAGARAPGTRKVRNVCVGFQDGSSALTDTGTANPMTALTQVVPLTADADPLAWHELPTSDGMSFRRARCLDVWTDHEGIHAEAFFQDSLPLPDGERYALHEYTLTAQADAEVLTLGAVRPVPRVLPHAECPQAVAGVERLVGTPLVELRSVVLRELRLTAGCTHLNDVLRSLADVPMLAGLCRSHV